VIFLRSGQLSVNIVEITDFSVRVVNGSWLSSRPSKIALEGEREGGAGIHVGRDVVAFLIVVEVV